LLRLCQDKAYQYLLCACEPYETVGFKIPNEPLDKGEGRFSTHWDDASHTFSIALYFATAADVEAMRRAASGSGGAPKRQTRAVAAGVLA